MIKITGAKFHNGKLDEESMKKVKESFGKDKMRINKIVKLDKRKKEVNEGSVKTISKSLSGEMDCPVCGEHYKRIELHKCKGEKK